MKYIVLLLFLFPNLNQLSHEYHVSHCKIHFSEKENSIQLSFHIFTNDLELALKSAVDTPLRLGSERERPETDQYIIDYLSKTFALKVNGQVRFADFIGKEFDESKRSVWIYFEIPLEIKINTISVFNKILFYEFEDQKNMIDLTGFSDEKISVIFQDDVFQKKFDMSH